MLEGDLRVRAEQVHFVRRANDRNSVFRAQLWQGDQGLGVPIDHYALHLAEVANALDLRGRIVAEAQGEVSGAFVSEVLGLSRQGRDLRTTVDRDSFRDDATSRLDRI